MTDVEGISNRNRNVEVFDTRPLNASFFNLINLREDGFLLELEERELTEWQKMRNLVGHRSMAI